MTPLTDAVTVVEQNLDIAAPVAAAFLTWLVYGVIGPAYLGADDDFWPIFRRRLVVVLDRVAQRTPGLYVTATSTQAEYAGYYHVDLAELPVDMDPADPWELALEKMGYDRNPVASVKTDYVGRQSDGSWARRYGYLKGTGAVLRSIHANTGALLSLVTWVPDSAGRILGALGDVLALRQVHVDIYVEVMRERGIARVHNYAHDEPNSLNPLTALNHYRAKTWNADRGVGKFLDDCRKYGYRLMDGAR